MAALLSSSACLEARRCSSRAALVPRAPASASGPSRSRHLAVPRFLWVSAVTASVLKESGHCRTPNSSYAMPWHVWLEASRMVGVTMRLWSGVNAIRAHLLVLSVEQNCQRSDTSSTSRWATMTCRWYLSALSLSHTSAASHLALNHPPLESMYAV